MPLEKIFTFLPYCIRSSKKPSVADWIRGVTEPAAWDEDFDKFHDFISITLENFLSWVCRSIKILHPFADAGWTNAIEWNALADFLEFGVNTLWSVAAIRNHCPSSRTAIAIFGRAVEQIYGSGISTSVPTVVLETQDTQWVQPVLEQAVRDPIFLADSHSSEIEEIAKWLERQTPSTLGT